MKIYVIQTKGKFNYEYKTYKDSKEILTAHTKRNFFYKKQIIEIKDINSNISCELKQENNSLFFLSCIPIINFFVPACPLNVYLNKHKIGEMYLETGRIDDKNIMILTHSNNCFSIRENDKQVAFIKKNKWVKYGGDEYEVLCDYDQRVEIMTALCVLIDLTNFTSDNNFYVLRYDSIKVLADHDYIGNWEPKENTDNRQDEIYY